MVFSFYTLAGTYTDAKQKISTHIVMNKQVLNSSVCESDESIGKTRFFLSGAGVNKTTVGETNIQVMVTTNIGINDILADVQDKLDRMSL